MTGCVFGIVQNTKFEKNSRLQSCFILQVPVWPWMRYSLPLKIDSFYLYGFSLGHTWPLLQGPHSRVSPSLSFGFLKESTAWAFWVVEIGCDWEGLGCRSRVCRGLTQKTQSALLSPALSLHSSPRMPSLFKAHLMT